jgi:tape measure domain-containing protein
MSEEAGLGTLVAKIVGDTSSFDAAMAHSKQTMIAVERSVMDLASTFKQLDGEAAVWGRSTEIISQKQAALKQQISNLIAQGIDPLDRSIEELQKKYYELGNEAIALEAKQKSLGQKFTEFGQTAGKVGLGLTAAVTVPVTLMAKAFVKSSGDMQMYMASFETMLGSAEKAKKLMEEMQKFAAATPFEFGQLANASKMLLQFGVTGEQVMPMLQTLGDIAQGDSNKLNSLALAFGQMSSTGRLMGQDLLQMINAGFNPLKEISESTGESMANLKKKMEKGQITTDMVTASFKRATSAGGQFFGGMEKASKTLPGVLSTLNDDFLTMGRSLVEDLMPAIMGIVKGFSNFFKWVTDLDPPTKKLVVTVAGIGAAIGPILLGVSALIPLFTSMSAAGMAAFAPIALVVGSLAALGLAIYGVSKIAYENSVEGFSNRLDKMGKKAIEASKKLEEIKKSTNDIIGPITEMNKGNTLTQEQVNKLILLYPNLVGQINAEKTSIEDVTEKIKEQQKIEAEGALKKLRASYLKVRGINAEMAGEIALKKLEVENAKTKYGPSDPRTKDAIGDLAFLTKVLTSNNQKIDLAFSAYSEAAQGFGYSIDSVTGNLITLNITTDKTVKKEGEVTKAIEKTTEQLEKEAKIRDDFSENFLTDMGRKIKAVEEERDAAIQAGFDKVKAEDWASAEIARIREESTKEVEEKLVAEFNIQKEFSNKKLKAIDKELAEKIKSIDEEAKKYKEAKVEEVEVDKWAESEKEKAKEEADKKKKAATISSVQSYTDIAMGAIDSLISSMNGSFEDTIADFTRSILDSATQILAMTGNSVAMVVSICTAVVSGIIGIIDTIGTNTKNQLKAYEEAFNNVNKRIAELHMQMIEDELDARLSAIDAEEKAALEAAGFRTQSASDQLRDQLAKETDWEKAAELSKELQKQEILDKFQADRDASEKKAADDKKKYAYDYAVYEQKLTLAQIEQERAKAIADLGWFNKGKKKEVNALYDELVGIVKSMPLPALASGGIVMPTSGGTPIIAGEGGEPEIISPLSKLDQVLARYNTSNVNAGNEMIHLQVNMDSKPFLDQIFPASKTKRILIDARAVV